jgi:hypothetical protein
MWQIIWGILCCSKRPVHHQLRAYRIRVVFTADTEKQIAVVESSPEMYRISTEYAGSTLFSKYVSLPLERNEDLSDEDIVVYFTTLTLDDRRDL